MSRSTLLLIGALLLTFGSGIGVGLFFGTPDVTAQDTSEKEAGTSSSAFFSSAEAEDRVKDNTLLSDRIRELEKELSAQKQDLQAVQAARLAFFKKYPSQVRIQSFDGGLTVTPEMADLLNLTPDEVKAVNQHMAEVKKVMDQFEQANTGVSKQTDNSFTIETPVNPQAKALKDNLASELSSDIGEDQSKFLLNYADFSPYSGLAQLASEKKDTEIDWADQNGKTQYTVKNIYFSPDGKTQGWSSSTSDSIPAQYQKYLTPSP